MATGDPVYHLFSFNKLVFVAFILSAISTQYRTQSLINRIQILSILLILSRKRSADNFRRK